MKIQCFVTERPGPLPFVVIRRDGGLHSAHLIQREARLEAIRYSWTNRRRA